MLAKMEPALQGRLSNLKTLALHVGCVPRHLRQLGAQLHADKQPTGRLDQFLAHPEEAMALAAEVSDDHCLQIIQC